MVLGFLRIQVDHNGRRGFSFGRQKLDRPPPFLPLSISCVLDIQRTKHWKAYWYIRPFQAWMHWRPLLFLPPSLALLQGQVSQARLHTLQGYHYAKYGELWVLCGWYRTSSCSLVMAASSFRPLISGGSIVHTFVISEVWSSGTKRGETYERNGRGLGTRLNGNGGMVTAAHGIDVSCDTLACLDPELPYFERKNLSSHPPSISYLKPRDTPFIICADRMRIAAKDKPWLWLPHCQETYFIYVL